MNQCLLLCNTHYLFRRMLRTSPIRWAISSRRGELPWIGNTMRGTTTTGRCWRLVRSKKKMKGKWDIIAQAVIDLKWLCARDGSVDHNMLRHIGASHRSPSPEGRGQSSDWNTAAADGRSVETGSSGGNSIFYKKSRLTNKQRANVRTAMLGFLENTRSEENILVKHYQF